MGGCCCCSSKGVGVNLAPTFYHVRNLSPFKQICLLDLTDLNFSSLSRILSNIVQTWFSSHYCFVYWWKMTMVFRLYCISDFQLYIMWLCGNFDFTLQRLSIYFFPIFSLGSISLANFLTQKEASSMFWWFLAFESVYTYLHSI